MSDGIPHEAVEAPSVYHIPPFKPPKMGYNAKPESGSGGDYVWHCPVCDRRLTTTNPPFAMWCPMCYVAVYNDKGKFIAIVEEPHV